MRAGQIPRRRPLTRISRPGKAAIVRIEPGNTTQKAGPFRKVKKTQLAHFFERRSGRGLTPLRHARQIEPLHGGRGPSSGKRQVAHAPRILSEHFFLHAKLRLQPAFVLVSSLRGIPGRPRGRRREYARQEQHEPDSPCPFHLTINTRTFPDLRVTSTTVPPPALRNRRSSSHPLPFSPRTCSVFNLSVRIGEFRTRWF